jgi:hypothetical protein
MMLPITLLAAKSVVLFPRDFVPLQTGQLVVVVVVVAVVLW